MSKILINLDADDAQWLARESITRQVPVDELVQEAIRALRLQITVRQTAGIFRADNGLETQRRLRNEWEHR